MMRHRSLRYPGLEGDTLNTYCDRDRVSCRDGEPAEIDETAAS